MALLSPQLPHAAPQNAAIAYLLQSREPRQFSMQKRSRTLTVALVVFFVTLAAVLLALNFSAGERKIKQQLLRLYGTSSPQFERGMGSLLAPGIAGGNKATELLNGDQIFPPML